MHKYKELLVWQKSFALTTEVYLLVKKLPASERYNLTSQITRCAVSISSNIAEGAGRDSPKEFSHFLSIAAGSAYELETQLLLSIAFNYVHKDELNDILNSLVHVQKMLFSLKRKLKSKGLDQIKTDDSRLL